MSDRHFSVDTASYGDLVLGASDVSLFGGINRNHCGFESRAQALRTSGDGYHAAGLEISNGPVCVLHSRTMEGATGTVIAIATGGQVGVYPRYSHIPFPNTPALRGIGAQWPLTSQNDSLTFGKLAVVMVGDFSFLKAPNLARYIIEDAVATTPPLCLFRNSLWGACQLFTRNLPSVGRSGGQVAFNPVERTHGALTSWMGVAAKLVNAVEFPPTLLTQVMGGRN